MQNGLGWGWSLELNQEDFLAAEKKSRTESQQSSDRSAFVDFVLLCVVYAKLELLLGKV